MELNGSLSEMVAIQTIWSSIFYLTRTRPILRSYFSSIVLCLTGYIGVYSSNIAFLSAYSSMSYYLTDLILMVSEYQKENLIYIIHHGMTLLLTWSALTNPEYMAMMSFISALMNTSTIFLNWKEMLKDKEYYKGWYPNMSFDQVQMMFGVVFLIVRGLIGIPFVIYTIMNTPNSLIIRLGLSLTIGFNLFWGSQILLKARDRFLKS